VRVSSSVDCNLLPDARYIRDFMATLLERYLDGEHVAVWDDLMALGEGVRHELYLEDARAVAAETMRRARHNVEELIRRLDTLGYRFLDSVSSAEDRLSQLDVIEQMSTILQSRPSASPGTYNSHSMQLLEGMKAFKEKMAPMLQKAAANAARAASAKRKPPLEDSNVFSPPGNKTSRQLAKLEKAAGGPLPLSLRAWYEQVGGVSLMGSHAVLNAVEFSNRGTLQQFKVLVRGPATSFPPARQDIAPDPLVIYPLEEMLDQAEGDEGGDELQLAISPDDLHKANVSGDAYYVRLPDARADFEFDDWHKSTFVNYLRAAFRWGGFPGWQRFSNPPQREIAELSEGLLPL
jgi:hypothetical protein